MPRDQQALNPGGGKTTTAQHATLLYYSCSGGQERLWSKGAGRTDKASDLKLMLLFAVYPLYAVICVSFELLYVREHNRKALETGEQMRIQISAWCPGCQL